MSATRLAPIAALLADRTRSEIVTALMDGRAYTGSELARHAGVASSTVSEHLSKLLDGGLVSVEAQGRHRYWRLASHEVAELLEMLIARTPAKPVPEPRAPAALAKARTCYDHLAGRIAVDIFDSLVAAGHLATNDHHLALTSSGLRLLADIGVDMIAVTDSRRPTARSCLDWTQRRHHLAGAAGKGLLEAMKNNGWVRPGPRPRVIVVSLTGTQALLDVFGVN